MTTPTRLALAALVSSAAPYFTPTSRVVSHSSGKLYENFSANALFSSGVSKLMPRISAFFFWYSCLWSRNPQPSAVQPGVSAFG